MSKTVKALNILDQDLNRTKARSTKIFDKVQEEKENKITMPRKVAEEVASFLSIRDQLSINQQTQLNQHLATSISLWII